MKKKIPHCSESLVYKKQYCERQEYDTLNEEDMCENLYIVLPLDPPSILNVI